MTHPAYETPRRVSTQAQVVLQDNRGPMTLDGTNTWLLAAAGSGSCVVVDPGQAGVGDAHLEAVLGDAPPVELVLLTHGHHDHSGLAASLAERTGAPVRALDPAYCHGSGSPLADGDVLHAAGLALRVLATPGHTADSVSFVLGGTSDMADMADMADPADPALVLTGDTILGRGTTVVAHPDGVLRDYLDSLHRLRDLGELAVLPGHGPELPSVRAVAAHYLQHRQERLEQIRTARARLGTDASARQIVELVYADVDQAVWWAAELSVQAQLDYLRGGG